MSLFSEIYEAYHRDQKRHLGGAYTMSSLPEMEDALGSGSNLFMKRLDEIATAGDAFNLGVGIVIALSKVSQRTLRLLAGLTPVLRL